MGARTGILLLLSGITFRSDIHRCRSLSLGPSPRSLRLGTAAHASRVSPTNCCRCEATQSAASNASQRTVLIRAREQK
uniref:Putative secreted protein n=1 Tax=Ixodes scapularis TaxID=6945 RepID=A0A4D5RC12_IXOSC